MNQGGRTVLAAAAALLLSAVTPPGAPAQGAAAPSATLDAVTLARGIKSSGLFGRDRVTPIDPTTTFLNSDLPYAIASFKTIDPSAVLAFKVVDPAGGGFTIDVHMPKRAKPWTDFDLALPMYILGTDFETHTGGWHVQVLAGGQVINDTPFQVQATTPAALPAIKSAVDQAPSQADLHWRYGAALALLGHPQEGIQELQSAIRLDGKYALYYISLGRVFEQQGRKADAIREYGTALKQKGSAYDAVFTAWAQAHLTRLQQAHTP